jgi:hypothetical protein
MPVEPDLACRRPIRCEAVPRGARGTAGRVRQRPACGSARAGGGVAASGTPPPGGHLGASSFAAAAAGPRCAAVPDDDGRIIANRACPSPGHHRAFHPRARLPGPVPGPAHQQHLPASRGLGRVPAAVHNPGRPNPLPGNGLGQLPSVRPRPPAARPESMPPGWADAGRRHLGVLQSACPRRDRPKARAESASRHQETPFPRHNL